AAWTVPEMTVEAVQVLMALQKRLTADEQLNLEQLRRLAAIASESLVSSLLTGAGATAHASGTLLALAIRAAPMCDSHRMDHFQIFLEVLQHRSPELAKAQGAAAQVATVLAQAIAALASSKTACRASGAAATTGARLVAVAFLSPALREKDDAMRLFVRGIVRGRYRQVRQDLPSDPRPRPPMDGDLELRTAPPGTARSPALGSGDDGGEGTDEESESSCSGSSSAAEESRVAGPVRQRPGRAGRKTERHTDRGEVKEADLAAQTMGSDFALQRVPKHARYGWFSMAIEQVAQGGCVVVVVVGAQLGHRMSATEALVAVVLGNGFLAVICMVVGAIGCREGLTTSLLARWTGFGVVGSQLLSFIVTLSLVSWFGIQAAIAGEGLHTITSGITSLQLSWPWTALNGFLVTLVAAFGFRYIVGIAWITGPAFLVAVVWALWRVEEAHAPSEDTQRMSVGEGTNLVVGGYIVGSVIVSDAFRFSRSKRQVVSQVLLPRSLAIIGYMLAGVQMARMCGTDDVIQIMKRTVGLWAVVVVVAGEMVINCTNLYFSGLALVAIGDQSCGFQLNRPVVTMICGVLGSVFGALGILKKFISFLTVLAVAFPPVPGIMCSEYFLVKAFRPSLEESRRAGGALPSWAPTVVPWALVIWLLGALAGKFLPLGAPYATSMLLPALLYFLGAQCGLSSRVYGSSRTQTCRDGDPDRST
ncbi:unnamed protein product, partial [Durusdinium trenchii]